MKSDDSRPGLRQVRLEDGLTAHYITSAGDPRLATFFACYDSAFILEDEKEDLEGFRACLALNDGPARADLSARYGPYREVIILLTDAGGTAVGGANFIAYAGMADDPSVSLSYIFVTAAERRRGRFGRLMALVREEAFRLVGSEDAVPAIYIEMNDPLTMDPGDYALDSRHAGLDQIDRLRIWQRRGAKLVEFAYRQPPLSARQTDGAALLLGVLDVPGDSLPACRLLAHMRRFFSITVLKGKDPASFPSAAAQLADLEARCARNEAIRLMPLDEVIGTSAQRLQHN